MLLLLFFFKLFFVKLYVGANEATDENEDATEMSPMQLAPDDSWTVDRLALEEVG